MFVFALVDFVYDQDVRMVQSRSGFGFANEALKVRFVSAEFLVQDFDSDATVEFLVLGQIDLAHSSSADGPDDFVMAEASTLFQSLCIGFNYVGDVSDSMRFQ